MPEFRISYRKDLRRVPLRYLSDWFLAHRGPQCGLLDSKF